MGLHFLDLNMNIYNWSDIPAQYKWAATDSDGCSFAFKIKPKKFCGQWIAGKFYQIHYLRTHNQINIDWEKSLEKRPKNDNRT